MKECFSCRTTKDAEAFSRNRRHADGLQDQCKSCDKLKRDAKYADPAAREARREYKRQWHRDHPNAGRDHSRARRERALARPRLLDLFCGAGGAAMGYHRAGFDVVGVDIKPQPNYPFEFHQADALTFPLEGFDVIHASPPCQAYSALSWHPQNRDVEYPDLIEATRCRLRSAGVPYVIENVEGAPLIDPTTLCGSSFGLPLKRHRLFETAFPVIALACAHASLPKRFRVWRHGEEIMSAFVPVYGTGGGKAAEHWPEAMGIDWMTRAEMAQAIPPAYTEHIGRSLMEAVTSVTGRSVKWAA